MSRVRVEFRLGMPGVGSWNGRWSGEGRNYAVVRSVPAETVAGWDSMSWRYAWNDGWCASITARVMEKGERAKKSDGFAGYDWMVDNIVRWGTPECQHEFRRLPEDQASDYGDGDWERCRWCRRTRRITPASEPVPQGEGEA